MLNIYYIFSWFNPASVENYSHFFSSIAHVRKENHVYEVLEPSTDIRSPVFNKLN